MRRCSASGASSRSAIARFSARRASFILGNDPGDVGAAVLVAVEPDAPPGHARAVVGDALEDRLGDVALGGQMRATVLGDRVAPTSRSRSTGSEADSYDVLRLLRYTAFRRGAPQYQKPSRWPRAGRRTGCQGRAIGSRAIARRPATVGRGSAAAPDSAARRAMRSPVGGWLRNSDGSGSPRPGSRIRSQTPRWWRSSLASAEARPAGSPVSPAASRSASNSGSVTAPSAAAR
jgi:hypothetical protein